MPAATRTSDGNTYQTTLLVTSKCQQQRYLSADSGETRGTGIPDIYCPRGDHGCDTLRGDDAGRVLLTEGAKRFFKCMRQT